MRNLSIPVALALVLGSGRNVMAADSQTLDKSDFVFTLSRVEADGASTVLDDTDRASAFGPGLCRCAGSLLADLSLTSTGSSKLGTGQLTVDLALGKDCNDSSATSACSSVGTLTLSATKLESSATFSTAEVFAAVAGGEMPACDRVDAGSASLWAIVRLDGERITSHPSLSLAVTSTTPSPPTAVAAELANQALRVSWTPPTDDSTIAGYQVLCTPIGSSTFDPAYQVCSSPAAGADPATRLAARDETLLCSGKVSSSSTSVRIGGLTNGTTYSVAVVAIDQGGTASAISEVVTGTPGPTVGFWELYDQNGGTAGGCSISGPRQSGSLLVVVILLVLMRPRRRHRRWRGPAPGVLLVLATAITLATTARAEDFATETTREPLGTSIRSWDLALGFGAYRPAIDQEFASRGSSVRPFEMAFSSSRRLLLALDVDRHLLHRFGTWSLAISAGYYSATGRSLAGDLVTSTGDETSLRVFPLSLGLAYRGDTLADNTGVPLVPFAKLGVDYALWTTSSSGGDSARGGTPGWHATVGLAFRLDAVDPRSARTLDQEWGINHTDVFLQTTRAALSGFGGGNHLDLSDTIWSAGLMFEM